MEAEGEATTVVEGFAEAITSEAMALGEAAFVEVEVKLDQTKSAIYAKSQDAGRRDTPLMNGSKHIIGSVNMLLALNGNPRLHITRAS